MRKTEQLQVVQDDHVESTWHVIQCTSRSVAANIKKQLLHTKYETHMSYLLSLVAVHAKCIDQCTIESFSEYYL